jgi:hypothetical protein
MDDAAGADDTTDEEAADDAPPTGGTDAVGRAALSDGAADVSGAELCLVDEWHPATNTNALRAKTARATWSRADREPRGQAAMSRAPGTRPIS